MERKRWRKNNRELESNKFRSSVQFVMSKIKQFLWLIFLCATSWLNIMRKKWARLRLQDLVDSVVPKSARTSIVREFGVNGTGKVHNCVLLSNLWRFKYQDKLFLKLDTVFHATLGQSLRARDYGNVFPMNKEKRIENKSHDRDFCCMIIDINCMIMKMSFFFNFSSVQCQKEKRSLS